MDYTGINSQIHRIQTSAQNFARQLLAKQIDHSAMISLVESQLKLNESLCKQIEKLERRIDALETNQKG